MLLQVKVLVRFQPFAAGKYSGNGTYIAAAEDVRARTLSRMQWRHTRVDAASILTRRGNTDPAADH